MCDVKRTAIALKRVTFGVCGQLLATYSSTMNQRRLNHAGVNAVHPYFLASKLLNFFQRAAQIAVPMFTYLALGGRRALAAKVFASQCFVTIGYNCVPVPGAMGVADYLMVDAFTDLMPFEDALHLEMLSRSISFYICVAVSGVIVLVGYLLQRNRKRR